MNTSKLPIVRKAYKVYHKGMLKRYNACDGYSLDELPVTYADTPSEAKKNAKDLNDYEINGNPHTFTDIRVLRAKGADIVLWDGNEITRNHLEFSIKEQERVNKRREAIEKYPDGSYFYVQNGFVGNSVCFWRKKSAGYTTEIDNAEMFSKNEILEKFVNGREEDIIWAATHINEIISRHVNANKLDYSYRH